MTEQLARAIDSMPQQFREVLLLRLHHGMTSREIAHTLARSPDTVRTQISNFRYYQDRKTGDVVVFATRFGENSEKEWKKADYYQYRVSISR